MPRASSSGGKTEGETTTRKRRTKAADEAAPAPEPKPTRSATSEAPEPRAESRRERPASPAPATTIRTPLNPPGESPSSRAEPSAPPSQRPAPSERPQHSDAPRHPQQNGQGGSGGSGGSGGPGGSSGGGYQGSQQGQRPYGHSGGGGGGGGGSYQNRENRPYQHGGQGGMNQQGGGRRKKKKRKGGMGYAGPGAGYSSSVPAGILPSDEDLDREAAALEEIARTPDYKKAEKNALHISELQRMEITELHKFVEKQGFTDFHRLPRQELIFQLLKKNAAETGLVFGEGTLEIAHEGYGFLRSKEQSYLSSLDDIYVAPTQIRRMGLRKGMEIKGAIRPPRDNERFFALLRIDEINGGEPARARSLPIFEDLTPLHPEQRYVLETTPDEIEMRIVDLVAPIGRGQRGLIVAPPRTGKTVLLQKITRAINANYPEVKIIVLLIDERPEEVTDFRRNTSDTVEVVASTFDEDSSRHVTVAEMVIEKARRWVEFGEHVVILLDSITRLARAYNAAQPHSGKIMTGGIDSNALTRPKKFFGSARAIEHGGSLTILGTALVDTGSKADEVIFEEFKGTGNSELHLDRKLVDKRIWPAIDVSASGTRREELLLDPKELELTYRLRKVLADMNVVEAMELMKSRLKKSKTNAEFLVTMNMG